MRRLALEEEPHPEQLLGAALILAYPHAAHLQQGCDPGVGLGSPLVAAG